MTNGSVYSEDDPHNRAMEDDDPKLNTEKRNTLTIINTNARSLCPKLDSLVDCYDELDVDIGIVTETWFRDGPDLDPALSDLDLGAGISSITLNREPNQQTGVAHGGVALLYKKKIGNFKKIDFPNPEKYEVLPVVGSLKGQSRKIVLVAAYIPPNLSVPRGAACVEHIGNIIQHVKRQ